MLGPLNPRRFLFFLPYSARPLQNVRVSIVVPVLGLAVLLPAQALELNFVPRIAELDWLLVGSLTLKLSLWFCRPGLTREHIARIAHGT
jgi:hypothetical protein